MPTHPLIDPGEVRFFSGSSNRPLASTMARSLNLRAGRHADHALQQRQPLHPAGRQRAIARGLHRAEPDAAGQRSSDGTADDDRHRAQRGGARNPRGDSVLLVCPIGQEGRPAHLDHGAAGGRSDRAGGRDARHDHDAALAAGARLLLGADRSADGALPVHAAISASAISATRSSLRPTRAAPNRRRALRTA